MSVLWLFKIYSDAGAKTLLFTNLLPTGSFANDVTVTLLAILVKDDTAPSLHSDATTHSQAQSPWTKEQCATWTWG